MKRKILMLLLSIILLISMTACTKDEKITNEKDQTNINENKETNLDTKSPSDDSNNKEENSQDYYVGTYYMALTDGTLAKDGTGTVILNQDKSCTYYYGQANYGCNSFTVNDHLICLQVSESSSDICLTLTVTNDMLIDANNEKYIKE